ncbi:serine O-acetyltransferase EpsC [Streptomyces kanamyceticus]|uniref:serine O-acetyltransferase EpsC n=1 Tax=Streptomyces kanamyceticus TaxID=1967 RepID=UPI0037DD6A19
MLLYPGIHALIAHRISHRLYQAGRKVPARAISLVARWLTGIEIHPGATIGRRLFIDHGSGVVIGEDAVIGDDVMIYHHVTLGSVGWWRDKSRPVGDRRHPEIGDHTILGAGVSVLGGVTIGAHSHVGAHSVVTASVPARSRIPALSRVGKEFGQESGTTSVGHERIRGAARG